MEDFNRFVTPELKTEDKAVEKSLRPQMLGDYIGQPKTKEKLNIFINV